VDFAGIVLHMYFNSEFIEGPEARTLCSECYSWFNFIYESYIIYTYYSVFLGILSGKS